jgi:predicted PurR-regulated permease PerM
MRRVAIVTTVVLLTVTLLMVTWRLRDILVLFVLSLAIAATAFGPVERLVGRGWSRTWALTLVYGVGLTGLVVLLVAGVIPLSSEFEPLVRDLTGLYGQVQAELLAASGTRPTLIARFPTGEQVIALITDREAALRQAVGATQVVASFLGQLALALVLAIYWSADHLRFERLWLSLLYPEHRLRTRMVWRQIETDVGAYIRSELTQSIVAALLFSAAFWWLGLKYPFTAAILAALAWFVPLVGGLLGLIPVLVLGWLSGPTVALAAGLYTLAVYLLLEFALERRLYHRKRYWGVVVILVMLAMGSAFGLLGLLAAPPLAVAIQLILDELLGRETATTTAAVSTDFAELRTRLARLQAQLAETAEPPPRLVSLVEQLTTLLDEADPSSVRPAPLTKPELALDPR